MQAPAGAGLPAPYGSTLAAAPSQARTPLKRRRRTNVVAIASSLLVPWVAFVVTFGVLSFSIHYQHPQLCAFICLLGFLAVLCCAVMATKAIWRKRAGETNREPTWYLFVSVTLLLCWLVAVVLGSSNFRSNMQPYYDITNLNTYPGVDPAKTHGQQLLDAGRVMFTRDSIVDTSKSFGFKDGSTYCVAPIVSSREKLASYDFWAVGVNCCAGNKADFQCGKYNSPRAHAGTRLMDEGQREYFRLAVEQAEATHKIRAQTPLFFHWTEDPIGETNLYQDRGFKFYILAVLMCFALQFFLVVLSTISFAQFSGR